MDKVVDALRAASIIPDVLPQDFEPEIQIEISFKEVVPLSTYLPPPDASNPPSLIIDHGDPNASYTLLMIDPDAPSRKEPQFAMWRHYIQTGFRVSSAGRQEAKSAVPPFTPYIGPGPKPGTGLHRYILLLVVEPEGFNPVTLGAEFVERRSFKALEWIKSSGGKVAGVTFFWSRNLEDAKLDIE